MFSSILPQNVATTACFIQESRGIIRWLQVHGQSENQLSIILYTVYILNNTFSTAMHLI
jgi:hypothetical protein